MGHGEIKGFEENAAPHYAKILALAGHRRKFWQKGENAAWLEIQSLFLETWSTSRDVLLLTSWSFREKLIFSVETQKS